MKVSELAKEINADVADILKVLKSLKLKASGDDPEISKGVSLVVRSHLNKEMPKDEEPVKKKAVRKKTAPKKKVAVKKKAVVKDKKSEKPTEVKKTVAKEKTEPKKDIEEKAKSKSAEVKKVVKKVVRKSVRVKNKDAKKESETPADKKPRKKISNEPVITLKPLGRKKRKQTREDSRSVADKDELADGVAEDDVRDALPVKNVEEAEEKININEDETQWVRTESLPDMEIKLPITVKDLSTKLQQKPSLILKELMRYGLFANINQSLDGDVVSRITQKFGFNLAKIKTQEQQLIEGHEQEEEDEKSLVTRAPVVTFMGHVDHGKTSLLDRIRKSKVTDIEHGGITQHIGAYSVETERGKITFLDTPGHEAFTAMRARGAHITDIVVLVVAADEGIMPQTQEAIDHAKAANVPIVVALNKMDRPNADPDRVKKQLSEINLASEDWGGTTVVAPVSATTGEGVDELLELILLEAEMLELRANPNKKASGIVIEGHLSQGKGVISTVIVQSGTLKAGDIIVVGPLYGKVKAMFDAHDKLTTQAGPSVSVAFLGLPHVPEAGEKFYVVANEKKAREITFKRREEAKDVRLGMQNKVSLEDLYSQITDGVSKELNVILKSDVQGSLEALKDSLAKIPSEKVRIKFIHSGVGDVNTSDVLLAAASQAIIIAFHVNIGPEAKRELEKEPVEVREYRIIYDAVNDMKKALEGMLDAKLQKNFLSRVEIKEVFKLSKSGIIAGCSVLKGKVTRKASVDVFRNGEIIYSGKIESLKRFKDDVKEVTEGMECGISIAGFKEIQAGDIIEAYEVESIAQKL